MGINQTISTAGTFVLGQSHGENFMYHKQNSQENSKTTTSPYETENLSNIDDEESSEFLDESLDYMESNLRDSKYDPEYEDIDDESRDSQRNNHHHNKNGKNGHNGNKASLFDERLSFIGRLFNFNVWDHVKNNKSIYSLYTDCKLAHCGNATQWSDFRHGTRGDVKMKWPTDLLWKSNLKSPTSIIK